MFIQSLSSVKNSEKLKCYINHSISTVTGLLFEILCKGYVFSFTQISLNYTTLEATVFANYIFKNLKIKFILWHSSPQRTENQLCFR
jgi:hypothetical protein